MTPVKDSPLQITPSNANGLDDMSFPEELDKTVSTVGIFPIRGICNNFPSASARMGDILSPPFEITTLGKILQCC